MNALLNEEPQVKAFSRIDAAKQVAQKAEGQVIRSENYDNEGKCVLPAGTNILYKMWAIVKYGFEYCIYLALYIINLFYISIFWRFRNLWTQRARSNELMGKAREQFESSSCSMHTTTYVRQCVIAMWSFTLFEINIIPLW